MSYPLTRYVSYKKLPYPVYFIILIIIKNSLSWEGVQKSNLELVINYNYDPDLKAKCIIFWLVSDNPLETLSSLRISEN